MNILDKIIHQKKVQLENDKIDRPAKKIEQSEWFSRECISLAKSLRDNYHSGIIAEFKRRSPSKGVLNEQAMVTSVVSGYEAAGASAVSILTDREFFGGDSDDLTSARNITKIPILRKDFVIDEYQVLEAKAIGADLILLIAACLEPPEVKRLSSFAKSLGLEVLLEVHSEDELEKNLFDTIDLIGVNNRNLKNFDVNVDLSFKLADKIPGHFIRVSESGISSVETVRTLKQAGYLGFLMGENFMKEPDPAAACKEFIETL